MKWLLKTIEEPGVARLERVMAFPREKRRPLKAHGYPLNPENPSTIGAQPKMLDNNTTQSIDAVVTWVNAQDPAYQARLNAYLVSIGEQSARGGTGRYTESGEFAFCIASLLRFAPWLRTIYVIADDQRPSFHALLEQSGWAGRVKMVTHRELFTGFEQHLPTFNARSLQSMFWNLPELSERFIYLNDDFLLLRPVSPEDFFQQDAMVLSGRWMPNLSILSNHRVVGGMKTRPGNHAAQALSARRAGFQYRYFKVPHLPHPMFKSMLNDYFQSHPDQLEQNIGYAFRDERQFLADALVTHLALKQGRAIPMQGLKTLRLKPTDYHEPRLSQRLQTIVDREDIKFGCLQSLEEANKAMRVRLFKWLNEWIGDPARIFAEPVAATEVTS